MMPDSMGFRFSLIGIIAQSFLYSLIQQKRFVISRQGGETAFLSHLRGKPSASAIF
jgi:hypothetical protein